MTQVVLLVGTRKGCFVLSSDADRSDWAVRGPYCEGWPVYNAITDPAITAWLKLIAQPETITSIGMRDWAHVGQPL